MSNVCKRTGMHKYWSSLNYTQNEIIVTGKQKIEIFVNRKFLFGLIYIYKPPKSIQYKFSSFYL